MATVNSMARRFAEQVVKTAKENNIDTAEFKEESFLVWTVFGPMWETFTDRVKREATDFDKIGYGDMSRDEWTDELVDLVHEKIEAVCGR